MFHMWNYCVFGHCSLSDIVKSTTFVKLDQFPSSSERVGGTYPVGLLERGNLPQ